MIYVNVHEAKTHLSKYLKLAQDGKNIVLCKNNIPLVQLTPMKKKPKRVLGQYKGKLEVTDDFFKPLPKDILDAFNNPK
jgi:prevent-host-death family protein